MAEIITYTARFNTRGNVKRLGKFNPEPAWEWIVPVQWWAYDDDRLDARGPAKRVEAQVSVKAYDLKEARKLVVKEWGNYGSVGTAVEVAA